MGSCYMSLQGKDSLMSFHSISLQDYNAEMIGSQGNWAMGSFEIGKFEVMTRV